MFGILAGVLDVFVVAVILKMVHQYIHYSNAIEKTKEIESECELAHWLSECTAHTHKSH